MRVRVKPKAPSWARVICTVPYAPVTVLMTSAEIPLVPRSTPRSKSDRLVSVGTSWPFTVQVMPPPRSSSTVTSLPATSSNISAGTSVSPFMSMVMVSPGWAWLISS